MTPAMRTCMETSFTSRCISAGLRVIPIRWRRRLQKRSQLVVTLLTFVALVTLFQVFFALSSRRGAVPLEMSSQATAVDYVGTDTKQKSKFVSPPK